MDTPYLWKVFYEYFWEEWLCYKELQVCKKHLQPWNIHPNCSTPMPCTHVLAIYSHTKHWRVTSLIMYVWQSIHFQRTTEHNQMKHTHYINGLVQNCSIYNALALFCTQLQYIMSL